MRTEQDLTTDELAAVLAYWECALWSSVEINAENESDVCSRLLDENYNVSDLTAECKAEGLADLLAFMADNADDLAGVEPAQIGHDFWLTRNRHGAGFWDRGLGAAGERLTAAAHVYGSVDLFVTDDGRVTA